MQVGKFMCSSVFVAVVCQYQWVCLRRKILVHSWCEVLEASCYITYVVVFGKPLCKKQSPFPDKP